MSRQVGVEVSFKNYASIGIALLLSGVAVLFVVFTGWNPITAEHPVSADRVIPALEEQHDDDTGSQPQTTVESQPRRNGTAEREVLAHDTEVRMAITDKEIEPPVAVSRDKKKLARTSPSGPPPDICSGPVAESPTAR